MSIRSRKRDMRYLLDQALFGFYLMAVFCVIFFPIPLPINWPANLTWKDTVQSLAHVNLIPFNYSSLFASPINPRFVFQDVVMNILLTIPFGFGICFLKASRGKAIFYWAVGAGLALEGTQLLGKLILGVYYHAVDINDVLTNALGVLVGCGLYRAADWIVRKFKKYRSHPSPKKDY